MGKWKNDSDPTNIWDDESEDLDTRPRKAHPARKHRKPNHVPGTQFPARNQKPPEVSDLVWGLAEMWVEQGTQTFGRRPPVNLPEFSKRLSEKINTDPDVKRMLSPKRFNPETGYVQRVDLSPEQVAQRIERVNGILARMIEIFWENLEEGDQNTSSLQFKFLGDEWDQTWYDAEVSVDVRDIRSKSDEITTRPMNFRMADPAQVRARENARKVRQYLRDHPDEKHPDPPSPEQREQTRKRIRDFAEKHRKRNA